MNYDNESVGVVAGDPAEMLEVVDSAPENDAYEAFCDRRDNGEALDPDWYCAQFPAFEGRLRRLLQAHLYLEANPLLLEAPKNVAWPAAGERYLDFQLVQELGRGSFARVFLARVPKLGGRLAALKVTWHSGAEAAILGPLEHPNIVPVEDAVADGTLTAIRMPYLGSATLRDAMTKLDGLPSPPREARFFLEVATQLAHPLEPGAESARPAAFFERGIYSDGLRFIAAQLADALAFLHERGIYHRDLKPSNVLLTPQGKPMLLDFNVAAPAEGFAVDGGTFAYMAPERLTGTDQDSASSDVFSLGVILFELATGTHPFGPIPAGAGTEPSRRLLLERMRAGAADACRLNPGIEKSLGQLIGRCLAYDPVDRPGAAAIAKMLRTELRPAARVRRVLARHSRLSAAAFCVLAFLASAGAALDAARPPLAKRQFDAGIELHQKGQFREAVGQFSALLDADPHNAEAHLARARAYLAMAAADQRFYPSALADYQEADRLAPDGRSKAGIGYCLHLTGSDPRFVIASYQASRSFGGENAELCNNLGCCHLKLSQFAEAQANLDRAIELDPTLQAAHHNRALLQLQKALALARPAKGDAAQLQKRRAELADSVAAGIKDIAKAIDLGPAGAEHYYDAARIHALAAAIEPAQKESALSFLQTAIDRKLNPSNLRFDPCFRVLAADAGFKKLLNSAPPSDPSPRAVRIADPVR